MLIETAVRKVKPGNVHTGSDEALQHFQGVRRRADCSNDLGFMIGQYHQPRLQSACLTQGSIEGRAKSATVVLKSARFSSSLHLEFSGCQNKPRAGNTPRLERSAEDLSCTMKSR
jgi:hypothetical protein